MKKEHLRSIKYFWLEKRDVKRYVEWEDIQKDLEKEYPALWFAFNQLHTAENVIDSILDDIIDD